MINRSQPQTAVLKGGAGGGTWAPCILTWYDPALGGTNSASGAPDPHSKTSSGEPYDPNKDTCAAPPSYPFGTQLTFMFGNGTVVCRVNDRGGAIQGNHFDLSRHAAQALGIIGAGRVTASFQVGAVGGAPAASQPSGGGGGGGGSGADSGSLLSIITDLLTGNFEDLAVNMALAGVTVVKDLGLGIADWLIIPWWHWNQRAAQFYTQEELFTSDTSKWTTMPWTAAFWGLGYWLFWTDPDAKGSLAPAPIRSSRAARHVRSLQAIPARRSLVKPKNVKDKTAVKPKPVISRATLTQTDTMRVTRNVPVKVTGRNVAPRGTESETPIERAGTLRTEAPHDNATAPRKPNPADRTGASALPNSGGVANGNAKARGGRRGDS